MSRIKKLIILPFCLTPDTSRDTSHKEQVPEVIRYVHIHQEECSIEESFIDFSESHQKFGVGLASEITEKLESDGLNLEDCRGQGYDNGSNMSGKYNGVQAVINNLNQLAKYVPCAVDRENRSLQSKNVSFNIASKKMKGLIASIQNFRDNVVGEIIATLKLLT